MKALIYNDDGSSLLGEFDAASYVSKHLQLGEVANPSCNKSIKYIQTKDTRKALRCWEYVRERYGKGITISCSYREKDWNKAVGGTSDSLHLSGCAFDCQMPMSDSLFKDFCQWSEIAAEKYRTQAEVLRYSWGVHLGFGKLNYTTKTIYISDKR